MVTARPDATLTGTDVPTGEGEKLFRAIFENSGTGMALVDRNGCPVECNPAFLELLGYTSSELRQMPFGDFTHPADRDRDWELFAQLMDGALDKYEIEKRYLAKDGRTIWGSLIATAIKDQ